MSGFKIDYFVTKKLTVFKKFYHVNFYYLYFREINNLIAQTKFLWTYCITVLHFLLVSNNSFWESVEIWVGFGIKTCLKWNPWWNGSVLTCWKVSLMQFLLHSVKIVRTCKFFKDELNLTSLANHLEVMRLPIGIFISSKFGNETGAAEYTGTLTIQLFLEINFVTRRLCFYYPATSKSCLRYCY